MNIYSKDIVHCCGLCINSQKIDDEIYTCEKNGQVLYNNTCKGFKYDIFKKTVRRKIGIKFKEYKAEDFSI